MLQWLMHLFADRKFVLLFLGTSAASFLLFLALTMLFPYSQFIFFNYFLKEAVGFAVEGTAVMLAFSIALGLATSILAAKFGNRLAGRLGAFFGILAVLYLIAFALTLSSNSYSIFSFAEMNGFAYAMASFLLLAAILPLSSALIVDAYRTMKDAKSCSSAASGIGVALFSMGCPACGALLPSLAGIAAGLAAFPFKGLELKVLSLGLLGIAAQKTKGLETRRAQEAKGANSAKETFAAAMHSKTKEGAKEVHSARGTFSGFKSLENAMLAGIILTAALVSFNQLQISGISGSLGTAMATARGSPAVGADLSDADVSQVNSTAMAIATVFPGLQDAKDEQDVIAMLLPSGTPEYSGALGGISFDDPVSSLNYLSKWYYSLKEEVMQNNAAVWQRYLRLAAAPRGISCEFCCGVGYQGISADGQLKCGCQHNPAVQAITLGLMKSTDYSDAEILREVMRWKTLWFPKNMIALGVQVAGQSPEQVQNLPGMVGGC